MLREQTEGRSEVIGGDRVDNGAQTELKPVL